MKGMDTLQHAAQYLYQTYYFKPHHTNRWDTREIHLAYLKLQTVMKHLGDTEAN